MPDRERAHRREVLSGAFAEPAARARAPALMAPSTPTTALVIGSSFSPRLDARRVADAIARGLLAGGAQTPDLALLDSASARDIGAELAGLAFDARMRRARAVILAVASLDPRTLARSPAFEIASRARQAGVPAYALARESRVSSFDARMLDLQLVLVARTEGALSDAGRDLAAVI